MLGDPSAIASNPAAAACLTLGVPLVNILSSLNVDRDSEPSSTLILVNLFRPKDLMSEDDYEDALVGNKAQKYSFFFCLFSFVILKGGYSSRNGAVWTHQ